MRKILLILLPLMIPAILLAEAPRAMQVVPKSRRYALLIGVNDYPKEELLKKLPSAVKDMKDLAGALEQYADFPRENITLMTDDSPENLHPTRANIQEQIAKIRDKLTKNDLLIVAFSGHGVTIDYSDGKDARPYFCVRDTDLPDIGTLLNRDWVFEQIDKCKADRKIFFCDACRTLYTTDKLIQLASRSGQNASIRSLQDPSETWGYNYVLMSSCAKGQNSIDTGSNGLFTSYLLEGLRTSAAALRDGDLTAFSWFDYAAKKTEIISEQMIRENPALVIGAEKQTQQTPRIECRGEMSRFVIAKLDRAGYDIIPQEVEDVQVREYKIGSLKIQFHSSGSMLPGEKIRAGRIQLPPIPDKVNELTGVVQGIKDALTRMENGTHEALRDAQRVKIDAQTQYEAIKLRRDEEWKRLTPEVRNALEQRIKESPTSTPTSFSALKPKEVSFSQFIKLVLWGQKTEQARLERERVDNAIEGEIQKEIARIKTTLAGKNQTLQTETEKFRQSVVQFLLEQTPDWKKPNDDVELDYMFLSETIPALLKYPFGWDEESLFALAEDIWKTKRSGNTDAPILGAKAGERTVIIINGVEFAFRYCPPGTFTMGSPVSEEGRTAWINETQHTVTLSKGFWIMETEVTQKQWKAVMGLPSPSDFKGDDLPVEKVSWKECQGFCKKCTELGLPVQLPTEAQWEYACRAGTTGAYSGDLNDVAWYYLNTNKTQPVAKKTPNAWGLYDMHGNVWEWCEDWYGNYSSENVTDPTGPKNGSYRVGRGGGWFNDAKFCRSAYRYNASSGFKGNGLGFRCVKGQ